MKRRSFAMLALLLPAGCQTGGAGRADPPQAAIDACTRNAELYQNAAPGTATFRGVDEANVSVDNPSAAGSNWALQVVVKGVAMVCIVTADGTVQELKPI
jgi:hypothetical protein